MPQIFNKITIVGVGLIGGSLGRAIMKKKLSRRVVAVVRRKSAGDLTYEYGAADEIQRNLKKAVTGADLVILATPIESIIRLLRRIKPYVHSSAVVIDVGSTKEEIEQAAIEAGYKTSSTPKSAGPTFVGCHPLTGSEKTGLRNSSPNLFRKSVCFVTDKNTKVTRFWKAVGARTYQLSADSHDNFAAHASHLPHLLAFLMFFGWESKYPLANPSIREFLRLSKSDPEMWAQVFSSNSRWLLHEVDGLSTQLKRWRKAIAKKDKRQLGRLIRLSQSIHSHAR